MGNAYSNTYDHFLGFRDVKDPLHDVWKMHGRCEKDGAKTLRHCGIAKRRSEGANVEACIGNIEAFVYEQVYAGRGAKKLVHIYVMLRASLLVLSLDAHEREEISAEPHVSVLVSLGEGDRHFDVRPRFRTTSGFLLEQSSQFFRLLSICHDHFPWLGVSPGWSPSGQLDYLRYGLSWNRVGKKSADTSPGANRVTELHKQYLLKMKYAHKCEDTTEGAAPPHLREEKEFR